MKKILFVSVLLLLLSTDLLSQIRIKEITSAIPKNFVGFSETSKREIIPLNKNWTVKPKDSKKEGVKTNIPLTYNLNKLMVFQKNLILHYPEIDNYIFKIHFFGISYSADIFLNEIAVYKKPGGNIPFTVELPNDLINNNGENILKIIVKNGLNSQNTIPLFQRFLFPKNSCGIVRDVFLEIIPKENLQLTGYSTQIQNNNKTAELNLDFDYNITASQKKDKYYAQVTLLDNDNNIVAKQKSELAGDKNKLLLNLIVKNARFWEPEKPYRYLAEFMLIKNDSLIDKSKKRITLAKFENRPDGIFLNNKKIIFNGVTYISSDKEYGALTNYSTLKKDLQIIKSLGINSIRFAKATPHPLALELCNELGIIPFVELPLNSPPELIIKENNFQKRAYRFMNNYLKEYLSFSPLLVLGVGSGYLPNSSVTSNLITRLANVAHNKSNIITYGSFIDLPKREVTNLDLYGIEIFNNLTKVNKSLINSTIDKSKIFISESTYPTYNGTTNGYLNKFSYEAQARFFGQIIDYTNSQKIAGFFLNTMFDYYGDFNSLYSKYTPDNLYRIGILGVDKSPDRLSYNIIKSKLKTLKRVTIPLGNAKNDTPMLFIVAGLLLSLFMGIIINSKKKLREDATRALLRPYNFFADIRDHRIMSGIATIIIMIILAGSHSLLITSLLYYFRDSILFEKGIIAFGVPALVHFISYFAWHPTEAFFFFSGLSILSFFLLSGVIYLASSFIKIRIYFQSIFFTVVWAALPLALLLPVKMVLYRILSAESINLYIFIFLALYFLWIVKRIIKGIYVIFDISAAAAYFYSIVFSGIVIGAVLLYFQISHSTIYYLINVFNQANLL
jgi:beta-galactosidase